MPPTHPTHHSALTKVGKSVLHYEKEEYYGGEDWPSFHFDALRAWTEAHRGKTRDDAPAPVPELRDTPPPLQRQWPTTRWRTAGGIEHSNKEEAEVEGGAKEQTKRDPPLDPHAPAQSHVVPLATHAYIQVLHVYEKPAAVSEPSLGEEGEQPSPPISPLSSLLAKSREFNLDLSPTLLMAGGDIISPLLSSGVANYLEFRPLQALYIASSSSSSSAASLSFHKVPCSKTDVFASHLLPAKEKRQLMKFLQLVADWGFRAQSGKDAHVRNETELGQGRSLQRPQNKATVDMDAEAFLDQPFSSFLTHCKMDGHLQWVVLHALALVSKTEAVATEAGLRRVFKHLQGLGQYGNTAFLWPLYGSGDVIQAFCRTASVWGATFLLREQPAHLVLHPETGACLGVLDKEGGAVACEYVVLGCGGGLGRKEESKRKKAVRRIVLLDQPPAALAGNADAVSTSTENSSSSSSPTTNPAGHCGGVFPPGTLPLSTEFPHPTVHFYCVDPPAKCAPADVYILYLSTTLETEGQDPLPLLDAAVAALVPSPTENVLWALTFEQPLGSPTSTPTHAPENVLCIQREPPEFYLQAPLEQAQALFQRICPGEAFLPAEVPEGVLQFDFLASNETEDDEEEILERAIAQTVLGSAASGSKEEEGAVAEEEKGT